MNEGVDSAPHSVGRVRSVVTLGFIAVVAVATVTLLVLAGQAGVKAALRATRWWAVAGALGLSGMSVVAEGAALAALGGDMRPRTVFRMARAYVVGGFAGSVTPYALGGGPAWVWALHREGLDIGEASAVLAGRAIAAGSFFALMSVAAALLAPSLTGAPPALALALVVPVTAVICAVMVARDPGRSGDRVEAGVRWVGTRLRSRRIEASAEGAPAHVERFSCNMRSLLEHPVMLGGALLLIALSRFCQLLAIPLLLPASDQGLPLGSMLAALLTVWVLASVIPAPGGEGVAQGVVIGVFGALGYHQSAAATALTWRACTYYPLLLLGGVMFTRLIAEEAAAIGGASARRSRQGA